MRILLTGATGFLGFRTLERLVTLSKIEHITATGRTLTAARTLTHPRISYRLGSLNDAGFVRELVAGTDIVLNLAALSSPWGSLSTFEAANIVTQRHLIEAARVADVKRFVYISTPSIYCNGHSRWMVQESDPLPPTFVNAYASTKYAAEELLRVSGLPYLILRPRAIIGRGDSIIMPRLIRAYDEGRLRIIGNGQNIVDLTAVANVVEAIRLCISASGTALNQAYNITNGEPVKLWDCIAEVLQALGRPLGARHVPAWVADRLAAVLEWHARRTHGQEPTLTRYGVGTLSQTFTLDISKARELLGYQPQQTTQEAITEFVNWYRLENL